MTHIQRRHAVIFVPQTRKLREIPGIKKIWRTKSYKQKVNREVAGNLDRKKVNRKGTISADTQNIRLTARAAPDIYITVRQHDP